jgi:hypothetical protein
MASGNRNGTETQRRGAIDHRPCVMRKVVHGVFTGVNVKVDFEHGHS